MAVTATTSKNTDQVQTRTRVQNEIINSNKPKAIPKESDSDAAIVEVTTKKRSSIQKELLNYGAFQKPDQVEKKPKSTSSDTTTTKTAEPERKKIQDEIISSNKQVVA